MNKIETMTQRTPHYYKSFKCISSECRDNCCEGGWQIDIDDETLDYYRTLPGTLGKSLRENIDFSTGCFKLKDGRCPFLDKNNLCIICQEIGFEHIGVVCDQFPRYTEYYGSVKERGIGLACEEAARIIISDRKPFTYDESPIAEEPFSDDEYDSRLAEELFKLRNLFMDLIESPCYTFAEKITAMLFAANNIQKAINENNYEDIEKTCHEFQAQFINKHNYIYESTPENREFDTESSMTRIWYAYLGMETLGDEWDEISKQVMDKLHPEERLTDENSHENNTCSVFYTDLINKFSEYTSNNYKDDLSEYQNLLKYYIFRYMMKASYDHDLFGKIQLASANMLILRDMETAHFINSNFKYTLSDRMNIIHIFSREVEYSEDNINSLYEEFIFDEIFSAENLAQIFRAVFKIT